MHFSPSPYVNIYPTFSFCLSLYTHTHTRSSVCSSMFGLCTFPHRRTYSSQIWRDYRGLPRWSYRRLNISDPDAKWQFPINELYGSDGVFAVPHPATRNCLPSNNRFCYADNIVRASRICAMYLHQFFFVTVSPDKIFVFRFFAPYIYDLSPSKTRQFF
jgi:hypothetical protein